nr:reverse transcriptase domain-containing protein [Tanacetum cinerariifolium]
QGGGWDTTYEDGRKNWVEIYEIMFDPKLILLGAQLLILTLSSSTSSSACSDFSSASAVKPNILHFSRKVLGVKPMNLADVGLSMNELRMDIDDQIIIASSIVCPILKYDITTFADVLGVIPIALVKNSDSKRVAINKLLGQRVGSCTKPSGEMIPCAIKGRVAKWAIVLGEHEIEFKGKNSIKGQILADFLAETSSTEIEEEKDGGAKRKEPELELESTWKLFTDGASSSDGSGAGLMLVNPEGKEYPYALRFEFETTNNEAEYEVLIAGLRIAKEMQIQELAIFVDSQLVANQVKGLFEARQQTIKQYLEKTIALMSSFPNYLIEHNKREQNKKADALNKLASMTFSKLAKEVLVKVIQTKSIVEKEIIDTVKEDEDSWMVPVREYMKEGILRKDPQKARKLHIKTPLYRMI